MTDEYFQQQAYREACRAFEEEEVPVGAVVVIRDTIVARGYNQVEKLNDATAHAEIIALTAAFQYTGSKYLPEATIYITVEPCLMCAGALYWSKIGRIVYGAHDEKNGYRKHLSIQADNKDQPWPFHPKTVLSAGLLGETCAQLMKDFFKERRKSRW
ncbi:MAG: nucleoside deaminase [Williamsia sp.]|nr:nucleoside deaminase [Williamsia sp.]